MSHICYSRTNNENYNMHFIVIQKAIELHLVCVCVENEERKPILFFFIIVFVQKSDEIFILSIQQKIYDSLDVSLYDN